MMAAAKAAAFGALLVALCGAGAPPAAATGMRALLDGHEGSNYTEMANMTDMMGNMTDEGHDHDHDGDDHGDDGDDDTDTEDEDTDSEDDGADDGGGDGD